MQALRPFATVLAAGAVLLAAGCGGDDGGTASDSGGDKGAVTISGQSFPEATLVASMYEQLLDAKGYDASTQLVDTRDVYMADGQFPGSIQVVPEYVGGVVDYLNATANGPDAASLTTNDPAASLEAAQSLFDDAGITMLEPSAATDQNAFFVTQAYADSNGLSALSDLEGTSVVLAAAPDCADRPDCEAGLTDVYGIDITKILPLGFASDQTYQSVIKDESQLGLTSTTDGTLADQGLVLLDDDRGIQPAQNLVPAVDSAWASDNQEAVDALNELMAALDTEKLTELNGRVSVDREEPATVAKDFLSEAGLI